MKTLDGRTWCDKCKTLIECAIKHWIGASVFCHPCFMGMVPPTYPMSQRGAGKAA